MNHQLTRRQVLEDLPAYVLGALEPDDMLAVDRYLQEHADPELLARYEELEEATTLLALSADPISLPSSIKEGVMARVQADLANQTVQHQPIANPARSAPVNQQSRTEKSWLSDVNEWLLGLLRPAGWATAGGLVVAMLLFGYASTLQTQVEEANDQTALLEEQAEEANDQIVLLEEQAKEANDQIVLLEEQAEEANGQIALLEEQAEEAKGQIVLLEDQVQELSTGNQFLQQTNRALQQQIEQNENLLTVLATAQDQVILNGTDAAPSSSGTFSFADEKGVLVLDGLAPLSTDETYQLWLIPAEGEPLSVGLVDIADEITNSHLISLPPDAGEYAAVGLSQEPAGGSPAPTLVVMVGIQE